jgi:hypothetical protein
MSLCPHDPREAERWRSVVKRRRRLGHSKCLENHLERGRDSSVAATRMFWFDSHQGSPYFARTLAASPGSGSHLAGMAGWGKREALNSRCKLKVPAERHWCKQGDLSVVRPPTPVIGVCSSANRYAAIPFLSVTDEQFASGRGSGRSAYSTVWFRKSTRLRVRSKWLNRMRSRYQTARLAAAGKARE